MCSMERSNAVYFLINDCVLRFLVTYMLLLICFLLIVMVAANCPMSGNSDELYGLSFASLGCRNGLERSS